MWTRVWLKLSSQADAETVSDELWSLGAIGVEWRDETTFSEFGQSSFARQSEGQVELLAYFSAHTEVELLDALQQLDLAAEVVEISSFHERCWQSDWKQFFRPTRISPRITTRPTWDDRLPPGEHEVVLIIDPQMAFGTGTHETTRMCIQEIDGYLSHHPHCAVIDVGCGSGVLVMCACKLGASRYMGIDVDPVAIDVARDNWELNALGSSQRAPFFTTPLAEIEEEFDLVVANMLSSILRELSEPLRHVLAPGGRLVLGGVLVDEMEDFVDAFAQDDLVVRSIHSEGEWVCIAMERT